MPSFGQLFVSIGADIKGISKGFDDTEKGLKRFSRNLGKAGKDVTALGSKLTVGLTAPIVGASAAALKFSTDFNRAMANVATLIPGNTARVNELKGEVQDLAVETGKSTDDIAGGLFQVISAFGDSADSAKLLGINARAATAGLATTKEAIDLTSAVTKGYGDVTADAVQKAADLAFKTNELGQTTFPELAGAIGRVVPLAAELKLSQEELFGVMATATGVTGDTAEVSTQLRGVLQSLLAPTGDMAALFNALGIESGKALIQQQGLQGAINTVVGAAEASGKPLQKFISSIEGQTLALALAGPQADTFSAKLDAMQQAVGSVDNAFKAQTSGINKAGFEFEQLKIRAEVIAQRFGDALQPAFNAFLSVADKVAGAVELAVSAFAALPEPLQIAAIGLAAVLAASGPVLLGLGQLSFAAQSLITIFPQLAAASTALGVRVAAMGGAMQTAKLAVVGMGQAAVVAAAAFAAWKLGEWAAKNIPLVQKLGDIIVAFPLAIFGDKITGVTAAQNSLQRQAEALAKSLKDKFGVEIKRGNKTLQEWSKELRKAATELTGADKKTDAIRQSLAKAEKQTGQTGKAVKLFTAAVAKGEKQLDDIQKPIRFVQGELTDLERKVQLNSKAWEDLQGKAIQPIQQAFRTLETDIENVASTAFAAISNFESLTGALTTQTLQVSEADKAAFRLGDAYEALGIKSQAVADQELKALSDALEEIRKQAAEGNPEALAKLSEAERVYAEKVKGAGGPIESTGLLKGALQQVSTVITDLGKDIAERFTDKIKTGIGIIDDFAAAFIRLASEQVLGLVLNKIGGLIASIPGLERLRGVLSNIGGKKSIPGAPGAPDGVIPGGAGGAAGGIIGAVTGAVSAVSGVISNFQLARQENTLNAIEENTRRGTQFLGDRGDGGIVTSNLKILELTGYINASLDDIKASNWGILDALKAGVAVAGMAAVVTGTEATAANTEVLPGLPDQIAQGVRGRTRGASIPEPEPLPGPIRGRTRTDTGITEAIDLPGPVRGRTRTDTGITPAIEPITGIRGRTRLGTMPLVSEQTITDQTDDIIEELRRNNPLAFGSTNPFARLLLGGRDPIELGEQIGQSMDLSGLQREFEAAQSVADQSLGELHEQTQRLQDIQEVLEEQQPPVIINVNNPVLADDRMVDNLVGKIERKLRARTRGIR